MASADSNGQQQDSAYKRLAARSTALAAAAACLVLLVRLGYKPLTAWDEGIYAEVSREMLGHSWLAPHWNAVLWFEKPPLMLWITAVFFKLFGVHEWTARLGSALSGVALVALLHRWLAARCDQLGAWLSTLFLLSSFGFLHICGLGEMDVLLSLGCAVALFGLVKVQDKDPAGWYGFWLGFAIALMTKGAASVVLPVALVLIILFGRWGRGYYGRPFLFGFAMFLAIVLPWHIAMLQRYGSVFVSEYLGFHVMNRATSQIEGHVTHPWYYLGVLLISAIPWVLLYPFAMAATFRKPELRYLRLFSIFALVVLTFFSAVQTRLPHYIAPMYPALTLITAVYAADKLRAWRVPQQAAIQRTGWVLAALALWGVGALVTTAPRKRLHSAKFAPGAPPPDNRELAQLLKDVRRRSDLPDGPLLLWNAAHDVPITPAVFYAQRPVRQINLCPDSSGEPPDKPDKYTNDSQTLGEATATGEPRMILLDRSLLSGLPADEVFVPLESGKTLAVGTVTRRSIGTMEK
ncbi:MAG TPA: glycosyltransferase family 39 protein [Acidobacteriaceae bacterium]|jgi:4-amino-4-deoxy-L-arabinose transferase-like glycosyltransferase